MTLVSVSFLLLNFSRLLRHATGSKRWEQLAITCDIATLEAMIVKLRVYDALMRRHFSINAVQLSISGSCEKLRLSSLTGFFVGDRDIDFSRTELTHCRKMPMTF